MGLKAERLSRMQGCGRRFNADRSCFERRENRRLERFRPAAERGEAGMVGAGGIRPFFLTLRFFQVAFKISEHAFGNAGGLEAMVHHLLHSSRCGPFSKCVSLPDHRPARPDDCFRKADYRNRRCLYALCL